MELSFELPTPHLPDLSKHNDYNFTLAHLALSDPKYLKHYREDKKYTITDNSAFELKKPMGHDDILEAAHRLKAQEIIAPDSFQNGHMTIEATRDFLEHVKKRKEERNFKIMGVVQGANIPDWALCAHYFQKEPLINIIGASYVGCETFGEDACFARVAAVATMTTTKSKPIHLLGMGGNPKELSLHSHKAPIRSCDTSMPIVHGICDDKFCEEKGILGSKLSRPDNYFEYKLNPKQVANIEHNILTLRKFANAVNV